MFYSSKKLAGLLLFVGGVQSVLGIVIAETRHLDYSIAHNYISDLGIGPAALVFNGSMFLLGVLVTAAAYNVQRAFGSRLFSVVLALAGIGAAGVGIFNVHYMVIHAVFALTTFIFGAVSAIVAWKFEKAPLKYVSVALGALSLVALVLMLLGIDLGLGSGGMERMVAYPILLWMISFGGYLIGDSTATSTTSKA